MDTPPFTKGKREFLCIQDIHYSPSWFNRTLVIGWILCCELWPTWHSSRLKSAGILVRISLASSSIISWDDFPPPLVWKIQTKTVTTHFQFHVILFYVSMKKLINVFRKFEWSDFFCINLKIKSCTTADILLKKLWHCK